VSSLRVCPSRYGTLTMASALAMYRRPFTSAMPNGDIRSARNTSRTSATPSLSASRSRVMRFALGVAAPAFFIVRFMNQLRRPFFSAGLGGALVSATRTSPLGSTYSQRGCSSPRAKAVTARPCAGVGAVPSGQPTAGATLTVGIQRFCGAGNVGCGPVSAGDCACPEHDRQPNSSNGIRQRIGFIARTPDGMRRA